MYAIESRDKRAGPAGKELANRQTQMHDYAIQCFGTVLALPLCMEDNLRGRDLRDELYLLPLLDKAGVSLKGCESMNAV